MRKFLPSCGVLGLILLSACQTFTDGDRQLREQSNRVLDESLRQSGARVTPPPAVQAALIPPLEERDMLPGGGPRFDVSAKDMPARDFFLSLMDGANQNIVVHPDVAGAITFSLRRVTLDEVLAAVRDTYGYDYRRTTYGYQILPNKVITRSYDLNYLNLQRLGESDTRVSSGQVENSGNSNGNASSDSSSYSDDGSDNSTVTTLNASKVITRSNVDFWKEVEAVVRSIIGDDPGNSVMVNPQASMLVVRANSADQENVASFLAQAQRNLQRQVILETKILEVQLSDGFQSGINWSRLGDNSNIGGGVDAESLSGPTDIGGVFNAVLRFGDFSGLIQLLETQGQVRVLSSPRISTLNNQKAVIKVGTDEFFVTKVTSNSSVTTVAGITQPTQNLTLTPFFSGISLDVTPQIDESGVVTLHVRPTVSRVEDQNKVITLGEDNVYNLPLALSTVRQSDSIVRARSGQVVVIGGLLQNSNENNDANVPWASRLPIVGNLFKQQRKSLEKSELVILMRPQVVDDEVWLDELRKSADSFREQR
ncbi:secretin N-terminal domain-containing protein [Pseudomonas sp. LRF_L74]|uniref:secretin N-terminal domain-containing protein n=1 Tax=Pseudomonas sp. LRF_L74 TaxID=3369422 RepID=UPI003F6183C9